MMHLALGWHWMSKRSQLFGALLQRNSLFKISEPFILDEELNFRRTFPTCLGTMNARRRRRWPKSLTGRRKQVAFWINHKRVVMWWVQKGMHRSISYNFGMCDGASAMLKYWRTVETKSVSVTWHARANHVCTEWFQFIFNFNLFAHQICDYEIRCSKSHLRTTVG